ncbi:sensor histidine kinase [Sphingomonas jeddahensis]|nr:ATP-binding protein [Sphingomonas jeddahensis]
MTADVKAQMQKDPSTAVGQAEAALKYAREVRSPIMEATALWLKGEAYSRIVQHERAAKILAEARRIVDRAAPGSQLNADILLSEGGALYAKGEIGAALADLRRAHDMFRDAGGTRSRAKTLIMIALVHATGNDHAGALRYLDQALDAYRADPGLAVAIYNGRGLAFKELGRLQEAEAELAKALAMARQMKSVVVYAQILSNVADVHLDDNDLRAGNRTIGEGLALTTKPEAAAYRPTFIALAARAAFLRGDIPAAERLIAERFQGVDLTATLPPDRPAHDVAYRIYSKIARDDLALAHLAALKRLDDQATATARSNSAAIAAARFDFANQELRIAQLKAADLQKTVAFERARARAQRWVFVGVAAATLIIITLLAFGIVTLRRSRNALARTNVALGKALAAKTEFLATTSHEIRTPLNGILGMTQVMLANPKTDAEMRDRLSVVHGAGITMRALVDDILDVAKIETGKMTIEKTPTDIRRTIHEAARMWEDQARAKGLSFNVDLCSGPHCGMADSTRLRQIVFNLLSNAVKFTPGGNVIVTATVIGDRWRLTVADTGIGIAPDKHEIIFEPFRQADTGTTRQFGGTGLGLSICRSLSRAMGGDVIVSSVEGEGATFTLDLPYEPVEAPEAAAAAPGAGVLVVDRNPITRAMFKALLSPIGGPIFFAGSASEALEALATKQPATLLIDDATLRVEDDPIAATRTIAQAATSAHIALLGPPLERGEQGRLNEAGIAQFIAKPIGKEALVQVLFNDERHVTALVSEAA